MGKEVKCTLCAKLFARPYNLKKHMVLHSGETPFSCNECDLSFPSEFYLNKHIATNFKSLCGVKAHMSLHSGEMPYECNDCGKHFRLKVTLKEHMVTHTGIKEFKCEQCAVTYNRKIPFNKSYKRNS